MNKRCDFGYDRTIACVVFYVLYLPVRFDLTLFSTTSHRFYLFFKTANAIWGFVLGFDSSPSLHIRCSSFTWSQAITQLGVDQIQTDDA
jgi:hypothetical protein